MVGKVAGNASKGVSKVEGGAKTIAEQTRAKVETDFRKVMEGIRNSDMSVIRDLRGDGGIRGGQEPKPEQLQPRGAPEMPPPDLGRVGKLMNALGSLFPNPSDIIRRIGR